MKPTDRRSVPEDAPQASQREDMPRATPEELLAAYVTAGHAGANTDLDAEERAAVEAYLADNPARRDELARMAAVIDTVAQARPQPAREPAWDDMAARISLACDELAENQKLSPAAQWLARVRAWLEPLWQPRVAVVGLAGAVAVVIAVVLASRGDSGQVASRTDQATPGALVQDIEPAGPDSGPEAMRELAGLEPDSDDLLANDELDTVDDLVASGASLEDLDALDDVLDDLATLDDIDSLDTEDSLEEYATGLGPDVLTEADSPDYDDYDGWLEDLSAEELDALDAFTKNYLEKVRAG